MADVTALDKHACPACGAQADWHPKRQALICSHCGTRAPVELDRDTGNILEIPLVRALRELPDELRGWQTERRSVRCRSCHAVSVFEPGRVGQNCDFCGSAALVGYDELRAPIRPQSLLPFRLDERGARENLRRWFASRWLAPSRLRRKARLDALRGVYLPYWTFDAGVHCRWSAMSGEYYFTTQTYTDEKGRTRTRRVRHTRWQPSSGTVEHAFDDTPVPGTRGVKHDLLRSVEPFPTGDLVPYDTAYLSGFVVEHYQVVLIDAAQAARLSMERELYRQCAARVPGDTHRDLRIEPRYSGQTFKHVLVPVWLLGYRYRDKTYQALVNGYTGRVAGACPRSIWKILLLVLAGALAVAGVIALAAL